MALIVMDVVTLSIGQVGHEQAHVGQRVDGHAHLADLALRPGVVGVVAHLGGQVEGAREARLPGVEEELEALVGRLGRAEAGVLAHRPQLRAVHPRRGRPGCRGTTPGSPSWVRRVPALEVLGPVHGLDGDARVGQALGAVLGVLLLRCHAPRAYEGSGRPRATRGRLRPWTTPRTRFLALRHLRERPGAVPALLLRRPRVREGRVTRDRVRVRPPHGLPRRGRDVAVHPPGPHRH